MQNISKTVKNHGKVKEYQMLPNMCLTQRKKNLANLNYFGKNMSSTKMSVKNRTFFIAFLDELAQKKILKKKF